MLDDTVERVNTACLGACLSAWMTEYARLLKAGSLLHTFD